MRFTYEVYDQTGKRIEITTNFDEAEKEANDFNGIIKVYDNLREQFSYPLTSVDDFHGWRTKLERDFAWEPHSGKQFNFMQEDDGFHIKEEKRAAEIFVRNIAGNLPDSNKKTAAAVGKPQFSGIPPIAIMALGAAMQDGVNKYGLFNWRDSSVTSSVFYDAIIRHLLAWYSGERNAQDSSIHHLAHAMAGCAILLDAEFNMKLNDDRKEGKKVTSDELVFIKDK